MDQIRGRDQEQAGQTLKRPDLCWYAIHTRSRYEKVVDRLLAEKGFETFLPLSTVRSRLSFRRFREAQVPLFSGYTFVRFQSSAENYHEVRKTTGVANVVGYRKGPAAIPNSEIESLRTLLEQRIACNPIPSFVAGQRVVVTAGPLTGVEGEILRRRDRQQFIVKVQLLKRTLEVDLDPANLEVVSLGF